MEHLPSSFFQKYVRRVVLLASVLGFLYLTLYLSPQDISKAGLISFGVLILTLGLWITEYLPMAISGLIGCFLLYFFGRLFNYDVLITNSFFGFSSPSVWFVFSGLVIGAAMGISGLAKRISLNFLSYCKNSYPRLILGFLILSGILVFLIPSTDARTVALTLIVGMTGFHPKESEHNLLKGLSILVPISSSVMGIGVLASVSSITAVGLIEKYLGMQTSYLKWFILSYRRRSCL